MVANRKKLVHKFMLLPYHVQLSILRRLNLFTDEEMNTLPDTELFVSSFRRAKEKGVMDSLWEAIESEAN